MGNRLTRLGNNIRSGLRPSRRFSRPPLQIARPTLIYSSNQSYQPAPGDAVDPDQLSAMFGLLFVTHDQVADFEASAIEETALLSDVGTQTTLTTEDTNPPSPEQKQESCNIKRKPVGSSSTASSDVTIRVSAASAENPQRLSTDLIPGATNIDSSSQTVSSTANENQGDSANTPPQALRAAPNAEKTPDKQNEDGTSCVAGPLSGEVTPTEDELNRVVQEVEQPMSEAAITPDKIDEVVRSTEQPSPGEVVSFQDGVGEVTNDISLPLRAHSSGNHQVRNPLRMHADPLIFSAPPARFTVSETQIRYGDIGRSDDRDRISLIETTQIQTPVPEVTSQGGSEQQEVQVQSDARPQASRGHEVGFRRWGRAWLNGMRRLFRRRTLVRPRLNIRSHDGYKRWGFVGDDEYDYTQDPGTASNMKQT